MKQKRKVKSLISSKSDSSVLLSVLLFLVGGILVFGAVTLFTSSVGVASAEGEGDAFEYENGIEDKVEVLLNLKFAPDGGSATVNEMKFDGTTFYMEEGNKGISVETNSANIGDAYVNYLGGDSSATRINLASNNIAVIGGNGVKVLEGNNNATSLGGNTTTISQGGNSEVPAVMLGGETNTIGTNQVGSAIVGGSNNSISNAGHYDFIIGGSHNSINSDNVIVGGANVTANESNIFVFNDGGSFTPESSNAFYLYSQHGLGLNRAGAARNKGVDSEGAVSFGSIDITDPLRKCTSADVGVKGSWNGCLVGCTEVSSATNQWEMIDHGDVCEGLCDGSPKCIVNPIEPTPPSDYPSECTVGGVDTEHSIHCAPNRLAKYDDVLFETFLIDSDDKCENYDDSQNKCIFICEKDYHLTGNIAGGDGDTKKCYKDCILPWNNEKIKHNERRVAYNAEEVPCSNTDWDFPLTTAIVNAPTKSPNLEYPSTRIVGTMLKTTKSAGKSYESCTNYTHRKTLICNNGVLEIADGTKTSGVIALGGDGAWYGYDTCVTKDYQCPTSIYNLDRNHIINVAKDAPKTEWNDEDRGETEGIRGQYKLCRDWTPGVGNETCKLGLNGANGTIDDNFHYQLLKCNDHYSTGTDNNPYECKKSCQMKNTSGKRVRGDSAGEYLHGRVITGYKLSSELCGENGNGTCHEAKIVCDDGTWKMGSKAGAVNEDYLFNDCSLQPYTCVGFNLTQTWDYGSYNDCDPYAPISRFKCTIQPKKYDLVGCDNNYHTENNKYCVKNSKSARCNTAGKPSNASYDYSYETIYWRCAWNGTPVNSCWSPVLNDCDWHCNSNYHLEYEYGTPYCINNTRPIDCEDFVALPTYAHWDGNGQGTQGWVGTWNNGNWSPNVNGCGWSCDPGYEGDDCGNVITCTCSGNPDYSYCIDTNVQIDEPAACDWECYYGSDGAGGCLPPPDPDPVEPTPDPEPDPDPDPEPNYTCSAGQYLPKNSTSCSSCPCGSYCPGGTWSKSTTSDQGKYSCGAGKWSSAGSSSCSNISCGYYGSSACSATPNKCGAGEYSAAGSSSCNSCTSPNVLSSDQCSCEGIVEYTCSAGQYLPKNSTSCSQCPCGSYCPGGKWSKSTVDQGKYSCESGKYSAAGASSCNSCSSGQQPNSTQCSCEDIKYTCSEGQYLPKNATTCSQCPCGYYCPGGQFLKSTTSDQGKYSCGAGKWSSAGSSSCSNISCGYYGSSACSATPTKCASGKYSEAGSSSCSSCPANKEPDGYQCSCQPIQSVGYCGTSVNSCTLGGQASNPDDTNPAKNTWDCPQETGCYKCKDGYTDKGNGVCEAIPQTTCTFNGSMYAVGATVQGYTAQNDCSAACSTTTATCQNNGKWNKTIYAKCENKKVTSCAGIPGFPYDTIRYTCAMKTSVSDGCGGQFSCYSAQNCPAEYICAHGLSEGDTDYIPRENGDYCVRESGTPSEQEETTCVAAGYCPDTHMTDAEYQTCKNMYTWVDEVGVTCYPVGCCDTRCSLSNGYMNCY